MSNATKRTKYSDFMKLSSQQRLIQSQYFRKAKPTTIPVIVFTRNKDLPELPSCKFLMQKDKLLFTELNMVKQHILKYKNNQLNQSEAIYFGHNRKLPNPNIKVIDFVNQDFKDTEKDGWLHIQYGKQDIYG